MTGDRPARRVGTAAALVMILLAGAGLMAGCGLRTPGGVRVDQRSVDTAADDPDIRKLPPGPAPGADAEAIVQGFLEAAAADPSGSYAQAFLASGAVWSDRTAAQIYVPDSLTLKSTPGGPIARVEVKARSVGTLTTGGAFSPAAGAVDVDYQLRLTNGGWRISYAPPGILLAPRDLARTYRLVRTYVFNADRTRLVPQPGYVASDRAGLAGAAVHALLSDWSQSAPAADPPAAGVAGSPLTASAGVNLTTGLTALGSVVVRDGEATVDLGREAFTVPQDLRPLVVAQIASTLASVPGVFTVRVLVEERPYAGGPVAAEVPAEYQSPSRGPGLAVSPAGELVTFSSSRTAPLTVPGSLGRVAQPSVAPNGVTVAALLAGGPPGLAIGRLTSAPGQTGVADAFLLDRRVTLPASTAGYLQPQWLSSRRLLVVTADATPRAYVVDVANGQLHELPTSGLQGLGALAALQVSRDGTRVIAVAGAGSSTTPRPPRRAYLGEVVLPPEPASGDATTDASGGHVEGEEPLPELTGWTAVTSNLADVTSAAWADDLTVVLLGRPSAARRDLRAVTVSLERVSDPISLSSLPVDASVPEDAPPASSVAAGPGRPVVVTSGSNRWLLSEGRWLPLPAATGSTYG